MSQWGSAGPPPAAYSRVSDAERFRPLHDVALGMLRRIEATFSVERFEGYGLDGELERRDLGRPTIKLVPRDTRAAPLAIAFSVFPGLFLRVGYWTIDAFPGCGCDACAETADGEARRLAGLVDDVTAGRFLEEVRLPRLGSGWWQSELGAPGHHHSTRRARVGRARAREMLDAAGRSSNAWAPWPRLDVPASDI